MSLFPEDEFPTNPHTKNDTESSSKQESPPTQEKMTDYVEQCDSYCTSHDKLFDFLVYYFGKAMLPILIKNGDSGLISERFMFERLEDGDQFTIIVPDKYKQIYLQRMIDDWGKGHVSHVFNNINMEKQEFRNVFLKSLIKLEPSFQGKLAGMCSDKWLTGEYIEWLDDTFCDTSTPLQQCCNWEDIEMVKWICSHGCHGLNKALHIASEKGNTKLVIVLIDNNADVNQFDEIDQTQLFIACDKGNIIVVSLLLENMADVNYKDVELNPLHISCIKGHTEIVNKLLYYKADVNQCTADGESPLYLSCKEGHTEIVTILIENKADVNQCAHDGNSPLFIASQKGHTAIVNILINNKADINKFTEDGLSPLYIAFQSGHDEIVAKLLDNDANVMDVMFIACQLGDTAMVAKLLDSKAGVNGCTHKGETPLFVACEVWSEILKSNDISITLPTFNTSNKWHVKVSDRTKEKYSNTVKLLMEAEADITKCNKDGKSPLDLFQENEIIAMIKSWGRRDEVLYKRTNSH